MGPPSSTSLSRSTWRDRFRLNIPFRSPYWTLYLLLDDLGSRLLLGLGLLSAVASGIPLPLIAVVIRGVIDAFPAEESKLNQAVLQIVGISCAYFVVTFVWSVVWGELGLRISQRLQNRLVKKVMGLEQSFFDTDKFDITSILVSDTQTIQRGTSEKVGLFVQSCSYFVATFVTGFILNAALTGVLFAAIVPTMLLITWTFSHLISKYSKLASSLAAEAALIAEGAIHSAAIVQAFGAANILSGQHALLLRTSTRYGFNKVMAGALMLALVYWACYSLNALAFFWGSRIGGTPGTIYAVVFLVLDASFVFNQVGPFIQTIAAASAAGSRALEILNRVEHDIDVYRATESQCELRHMNNSIYFQKVDFSYPARPTVKVLKDLNLTIETGRSLAVVGSSGSGKSTLTGLLLRLYDPTGGRVVLGDVDIRDLHLQTLRSHLAIVEQDPVIFEGTVFENIKYGIIGSDNLSEEEQWSRCHEAASAANCDFIQDMKNGMLARISANEGLSGGQKQRICLARAFARKPALLVLDEPTSALDSTSERRIQEALMAFMRKPGTTIVTIAHRLSTVTDYDKIAVMSDGSIAEQGTHSELMNLNGLYKAMIEAQKVGSTIAYEGPSNSASRDATPIVLCSSSTSTNVDKEIQLYQDIGVDRASPVSRMPNSKLIRQCFELISPERSLLVLGIIAASIQGSTIAGEAIVFGHLVEVLKNTSDQRLLLDRVDFYSLMFFVISLVALTMSLINGLCFGLLSETFVLRVRDRMLRAILIQDQAWFQETDHSASRLIAGINQDCNGIAAMSGPLLQTLFATVAMMISGLIVGLVSAPLVAVVALSYVPAILLSAFLRVKMLHLYDQSHSLANKNAAAIASEAVRSIKTVAAFGLQLKISQRYESALHKPYKSSIILMVFGNMALSFSYSIIYFLYPLVYWWGTHQVRLGRYSQQQFFMMLPAIVIASQQCGQFFTMAPEATAALSAAQRVFQLLEHKPSIIQGREVPKPTNFLERLSAKPSGASSTVRSVHVGEKMDLSALQSRQTVRSSIGGISFRAVSLAYPSKPDSRALRKVSLTIKPGQFVAFVGPSGAGKSSLVALLERFFDPTEGTVFIGNEDIRSLSVEKHRSRIGLVAQEAKLFEGSILFNISLGAQPGAQVTHEQVESVCRACGIHDLISSLPEGYDTECGAQGSQLSGGQRQRIAVARALIRDPQVLLLDEATANLDSHSEKEIQQAVSSARYGRTTIVVAHRLSTVQEADCIFVFDKGSLVEQGTHSELITKASITFIFCEVKTDIEQRTLYHRMVQAQALG